MPPGNRLEKLQGDRIDTYSIRINRQWRVCFRWTAAGPEDVERDRLAPTLEGIQPLANA